MPKCDITVGFKDVEEPKIFENMDDFEVDVGGKFLYLYADIDVEWYILHDKILWFEIAYKGEADGK